MADIALLERVKASTIEIPPEVIIPEEHPDTALANEVKQLFNYGVLAEVVQEDLCRAQAEQESRTRLINLKNALEEHEIDVITNKSVEKYQKQMVAECNEPLNRAARPMLIFKEVVASLGFLLFLFLFVRFFPNYFLGKDESGGMHILGIAIGFIDFIFGASVLLHACAIKTPDIVGFEWKSVLIGNYPNKVPVKALRIARDVKRAFADANIQIEYIKQKERPPQNMDPFMYILLDGKKYYIAFWDEPKFEAEINPL